MNCLSGTFLVDVDVMHSECSKVQMYPLRLLQVNEVVHELSHNKKPVFA